MTTEQFLANFEVIAEDSTLTISRSIIRKLAKRAYQLQDDSDFSPEDVVEELFDEIPAALIEDDSDEWGDFIDEIADIVYAELSEDSGEDDSEDDL